MNDSFGVGIIGASAERGWAKDSHVPAVQGLNGLHLAAVASGSDEKGQAAASAFGAPKGYGSGLDLIADPAVAIVTIAVKVPDHAELVRSAIAAGKHVYCEWPLGTNTAETQELAEAARAAGVHTAIGLQLRGNAAVLQALSMVREGRIGRVLSAHIASPTAAFGPEVEPAMAFGEDARNGVTLLTIQGAHTIDAAIAVLGSFAGLSALLTTQFPDVTVGGKPAKRTTADHALVQARLASGAALGIEVAGGHAKDAPFLFEIIGTDGTLTLRGGAPRGVQSGKLDLLRNGETQFLQEGETTGLPEAASNVAAIYAMLRDDIQHNTTTAPGFDHALKLARLIDIVVASSEQGKCIAADGSAQS